MPLDSQTTTPGKDEYCEKCGEIVRSTRRDTVKHFVHVCNTALAVKLAGNQDGYVRGQKEQDDPDEPDNELVRNDGQFGVGA